MEPGGSWEGAGREPDSEERNRERQTDRGKEREHERQRRIKVLSWKGI